MPDQEYVRLNGGKTKPEDRAREIGPPPVKEQENRFSGTTIEFIYDASSDSFTCPPGRRLVFYREKPLQGVPFRCYRKSGCGTCPLRAGSSATQEGRRAGICG